MVSIDSTTACLPGFSRAGCLVEGHESRLIEDELGGGWVLLQVGDSDDVPGMSSTVGAWASSQDSAT